MNDNLYIEKNYSGNVIIIFKSMTDYPLKEAWTQSVPSQSTDRLT